MGLFERNVKLRFVCELERQHFLRFAGLGRNTRQLQKASDAVFEVNDEIAFVKLAEVDLSAVPAEFLRPLQPPASVCRVAAKQFRSGKGDQFPVGKDKATGKRSFDELDAFEIVHDFAEALDLAFGLEVDDDARPARAPFL